MGTESGIRNMTAGSPFRHILMFTLPLLAGNFLQQFYNMVDSWVVGNYVSDGALAAVGVGFPVIFLFTSLFSGIATGGTVVIAQSFGGGRPDRVRQGVRITVTMAVVWTVLSSALVVWLSVPLSRIFSPDPAVIAASVRYLQCVMPPYVLFAILFVLNSAMRGAGDSLYPMVNVVASVILLRVPFLYLLANRFGPDAMYWSYGIGWAVACALSVYHYAAGKWRGKYHSE